MKRRAKKRRGVEYRLLGLEETIYNTISWLAVILISGILAGILYVVITGAPYAVNLGENVIMFVVPARSSVYSAVKQTIVETVGVWFMLFLSAAGLYMMVHSVERVTSHRMANSMFLIGLIVFFIGALGLIAIATLEKRLTLLPWYIF